MNITGNKTLLRSLLAILLAAVLLSGCKKDESNPSEPLRPQGSGIYIMTFPQGAEITIDSVNTGKITPALITGLASGQHRLLLTRVDYEDYSANIYIKGTKIDTLDITLKRQ